MGGDATPLAGPDLSLGIGAADVADGGMLLGHAAGEPVLVARRGEEVFAVGAACTHYSGPLAEGLLVDDTVRCPWHHACFSLRTGEALRAPALNPVARWRVERVDDRLYVREKLPAPDGATPLARRAPATYSPRAIGIVGTGAAGNAAAEMLRREGYSGGLTLFGAEESVPYDRPNLSKDYLAGNAPEEWIPLRPPEFYAQHQIELASGARVTALDAAGRRLTLVDGTTREFDAILLATGADPVRLPIPGAELPQVRYLRSLTDSRAIIAAAGGARRAVVMGGSFIGLEVAASLRTRDLEVHVVAPEARPLERVLGPDLGDFIRRLHEEHGVVFHLGHTAASIEPHRVILDDGAQLEADLVVVGVGVRPTVALAEHAGLAMDRGVLVNEYLETSAAGVYAAGDIARWPDPHTGERIRVEHWVVAERQGQTAARNMLRGNGAPRERFDAVPFFWSQHYDVQISYVGHAERWDRIDVEGDIAARDCRISFRLGHRTPAVATIGRDLECLRAEVEMERSA